MTNILIAGCGALGSRIAYEIASPQIRLALLDFDVVAENNVTNGTSAFTRDCLGQPKTAALAALLFRRYRFAVDEMMNVRLTEENAHQVMRFDLVLDCFDNMPARRLLARHPNVLHIGVSTGDTGGAWWNGDYNLSADVNGPPVCTNALGRNLLRSTAALACAVIDEYLVLGQQKSAATNSWLRVMR
jgi:hypothetical protein